jgi:MFS family permease
MLRAARADQAPGGSRSMSDPSPADPPPSPSSPGAPPGPGRGTLGLSLLFGALYFVQGIAEPGEGLITQPVRSMLKGWGYSVGDIALLSLVIGLPWSFKPLYGLLTDFVPLAGSRRRSYLIATSGLTTLTLLWLYFNPPEPGAYYGLMALLLLPTLGVAFSDVVADGFMIDKGQPRGITGLLQSVQWGSNYTAGILAAVIGGWLAQTGRQEAGFLLCAGVTGVAFALALFAVDEDRPGPPRESPAGAVRALGTALRNPLILAVCAFLFLWSFQPFSPSVLYVYVTEEIGLSEQFYGYKMALLSTAAVAGSVAYGFYCRRVRFMTLIHLSIAAGVVCTTAYWFLRGAGSAVVVTLLVGFTYVTATLIQLDLTARVCPPRVAATLFALVMALSNLSLSLADGAGGFLYDLWAPLWGPRAAFNVLVAVGAGFTAICWFLVPALRRGDWAAAGPATSEP